MGDVIPWQTVQLHINGRSCDQISQHYNLVLRETLERSPFTKEEDALILACVEKFGDRNMCKVYKYLPHRNFKSIDNRYIRSLKQSMKIGPWSDEDNFKLIEFVKKYGFKDKLGEVARQLGRETRVIRTQLNRLIVQDKITNKKRFKTPAEVKEMAEQNSNFVTMFERRRKFVLDAAYETLKSALEKIYYHLKQPITLGNLSSISFPALKMLQKELLRRRKRSVRWNINMKWKTWLPNMEPDLPRIPNTSDSDDEVEEKAKEHKDVESNWGDPKVIIQNSYIKSKEKEMADEEKAFIQKVLHSKILEEANREPVFHTKKKLIANLDLGTTVEYTLCEEYLQQQMSCTKNISEEQDDMCILNDRNYKISLPEVIHHFVHPRVSEEVLVLPPNCATLDAMHEILDLDGKLRGIAGLVDHSVPYIRYLLNLIERKPKCIRCIQAENDGTSYESYENALDSMKSCLVIPTLEMKKSAMVETKLPGGISKECWCDELHESKAVVDLLTKRFIALFLWPYFLQGIEPRKSQSYLLKRKYEKGKRKRSKMCESDDEDCSKKKQRREDSEESETEDGSDEITCSPPTTRSQPKATEENVEVICLSDTPEDFCYAESTDIKF